MNALETCTWPAFSVLWSDSVLGYGIFVKLDPFHAESSDKKAKKIQQAMKGESQVLGGMTCLPSAPPPTHNIPRCAIWRTQHAFSQHQLSLLKAKGLCRGCFCHSWRQRGCAGAASRFHTGGTDLFITAATFSGLPVLGAVLLMGISPGGQNPVHE